MLRAGYPSRVAVHMTKIPRLTRLDSLPTTPTIDAAGVNIRFHGGTDALIVALVTHVMLGSDALALPLAFPGSFKLRRGHIPPPTPLHSTVKSLQSVLFAVRRPRGTSWCLADTAKPRSASPLELLREVFVVVTGRFCLSAALADAHQTVRFGAIPPEVC